MDRIKIDLGLYCNDAGKYVDEMHYCPVMWSKSNWNKMLADYLKKEEAKKKRELKKPMKKVINKPIKKQTKRLRKVTNVKPQKKKIVTIKKPVVK
jgi:DNA primase catalytic subunit